MNTKTFIRYLIGVTAFAILAISALNLFLPISKYIDFSIASLLVFFFFTIFIFFLGKKASASNSGNMFLYIIVINVFFKLIGSFLMVYLYVEVKNPESKIFVIPFLIIYLVYTIFETYFLSLLAQETN